MSLEVTRAQPSAHEIPAFIALYSQGTTEPRRSDESGIYDSIDRYMRTIRRYPCLSREEEHVLAVRFVETGDVTCAHRLITANLRLVVKIAHAFTRAGRNLTDLVQEGNLGLVQGVLKYDPHRGIKLSTYAAWWIRAFVLKFLLNNSRLVKVGTTQAQRKLFFNLRKEQERLTARGFVPTVDLLAARLAVSERDVTEMQLRMNANDLSLDTRLDPEDDPRTPLDIFEADAEQRPDHVVEQAEYRDLLLGKLHEFASSLSGRERLVYEERLVAEEPKTLGELGGRCGVSRERMRQLEVRLISRLREYLEAELVPGMPVGFSGTLLAEHAEHARA